MHQVMSIKASAPPLSTRPLGSGYTRDTSFTVPDPWPVRLAKPGTFPGVVEALCHRAVLYEPERLCDGRLAEEISAVVVGYLDGHPDTRGVTGSNQPGS